MNNLNKKWYKIVQIDDKLPLEITELSDSEVKALSDQNKKGVSSITTNGKGDGTILLTYYKESDNIKLLTTALNYIPDEIKEVI